jgi:hypothetical protein
MNDNKGGGGVNRVLLRVLPVLVTSLDASSLQKHKKSSRTLIKIGLQAAQL